MTAVSGVSLLGALSSAPFARRNSLSPTPINLFNVSHNPKTSANGLVAPLSGGVSSPNNALSLINRVKRQIANVQAALLTTRDTIDAANSAKQDTLKTVSKVVYATQDETVNRALYSYQDTLA